MYILVVVPTFGETIFADSAFDQCDQRWSFPTKVVVFEPEKSEKNSVVGGRFCGRFRGLEVATTIFAILVNFC